MHIFEQEKIDGLELDIAKASSVSYIQPTTNIDLTKEQLQEFMSTAANKNFELSHDLYPTSSLLVSTVINNNDDVFLPVETWRARTTPIHHPDNIDHNEEDIVGHMLDAVCVDDDGNVIDDTTKEEDLPELFHIITSSVIYTKWSDKAKETRILSLIQDIESGDKFVSMECKFRGFDYLLTDIEDSSKGHIVVERNEKTSFLTKYLRIFKGTGVYQGKRIFRILRNLYFIGKGYVDNPGNPDSIIFRPGEGLTLSTKNLTTYSDIGVSITGMSKASLTNEMENSKMSESANNVAVDELTAKAEELLKVNEGLVGHNQVLEAKNSELQSTVENLTKANEVLSQENTSLKEKNEVFEKESRVVARINKLIDGGVNKDTAKAKVEKYAELNDTQFDLISDDIIKASCTIIVVGGEKEGTEEAACDPNKGMAEENKALEQIVENAQANEPVITPAPAVDETVQARQKLAECIAKRISGRSAKKAAK